MDILSPTLLSHLFHSVKIRDLSSPYQVQNLCACFSLVFFYVRLFVWSFKDTRSLSLLKPHLYLSPSPHSRDKDESDLDPIDCWSILRGITNPGLSLLSPIGRFVVCCPHRRSDNPTSSGRLFSQNTHPIPFRSLSGDERFRDPVPPLTIPSYNFQGTRSPYSVFSSIVSVVKKFLTGPNLFFHLSLKTLPTKNDS